MPRKVINVTIADDGRDKGKVFQITEADAIRADKWGIRAMLALNKSGADIPDEIMKMGIVGILVIGIHKLRGVAWSDLEPLLDEMMACVRILPTPSVPNVVRDLYSDDIEEIATLSVLRKETFQLHMGFSPPGAPSTFPAGAAGVATS
jgi:hypothetical protein